MPTTNQKSKKMISTSPSNDYIRMMARRFTNPKYLLSFVIFGITIASFCVGLVNRAAICYIKYVILGFLRSFNDRIKKAYIFRKVVWKSFIRNSASRLCHIIYASSVPRIFVTNINCLQHWSPVTEHQCFLYLESLKSELGRKRNQM